VRTAAFGAANGNDWNNAWSMANLNSNWASVTAGDIVWIAGGTYTTGMHVDKSGASGNPIVIEKATDAGHGTDTGWSTCTGCNAQAIIAPANSSAISWDNNVTGSYVTIDGVVTNGIKAKFDDFDDSHHGALAFGGGGQTNVMVRNCDLSGPGTGTYLNPVNFLYHTNGAVIEMNWGPSTSNITFSYCDIHSAANLFYSGHSNNNLIFEHNRFFDNMSANQNIHANMMYNGDQCNTGGSNWIIRYNDFSGWQIEGIANYDVGLNGAFYIYGNIFHDVANPSSGSSSVIWPGCGATGDQCPCSPLGAPSGIFYIYNNTFVGTPANPLHVTNGQGRSVELNPGSISKNNIFWYADFTSPGVANSNSDYNFYPGSVTSGCATPCHSITSGANPFVAPGTNFRIKTNVSSLYPKNKGVAITNVAGQTYTTDPDGYPRPDVLSGLWDMGAYEDQNPGTSPIQSPSKTLTFPKLWP
jgi:hypothetical protein